MVLLHHWCLCTVVDTQEEDTKSQTGRWRRDKNSAAHHYTDTGPQERILTATTATWQRQPHLNSHRLVLVDGRWSTVTLWIYTGVWHCFPEWPDWPSTFLPSTPTVHYLTDIKWVRRGNGTVTATHPFSLLYLVMITRAPNINTN